MTTKPDNFEITRRDFLKVVFATTTAAAVSGAVPLWPADANDRPVSKPFNLTIDDSNYLVDPNFDYGSIRLPTHREHLLLEGLEGDDLKNELNQQFWQIEYLLEDPKKWELNEVEEWLDTEIEHEDLGAWQNNWRDRLRASGHTVTELEPPTETGKYILTFVPREGAPRITAKVQIIPTEPCPSCGTTLEPNGRCHACWGDVMGLCDACSGIMEDGFHRGVVIAIAFAGHGHLEAMQAQQLLIIV
jgi:hypothetical protein